MGTLRRLFDLEEEDRYDDEAMDRDGVRSCQCVKIR
jgi:hypothetical protein